MRPLSVSFLSLSLASLLALSFTSSSRAAEKPDPTGTWTWDFTTRNGNTITSTLKLKQEGNALTGTVTGRNGTETAIRNAKLTGDEISFQTVREREGNQFTTQYRGKIAGDTIKGQIESERDGQTRTREWQATRKGGKTANVTGDWQYTFTTSGGQTFEPTLRLKQDGEKVTGALVFNENERPISDGKFSNGELTFKVVRERDGETFTSKYNAKLEGDRLKGKVQSNWGGTERTYELDAKRVKN